MFETAITAVSVVLVVWIIWRFNKTVTRGTKTLENITASLAARADADAAKRNLQTVEEFKNLGKVYLSNSMDIFMQLQEQDSIDQMREEIEALKTARAKKRSKE